VLRDGQRAERAIKRVARVRGARQLEQKREVLEPNARHLVHEDERALKDRHRLLVRRADGRVALQLLAALAQVDAPQLEAAGQVLERPLEEHVARRRRRFALGVEVAHPVFERETVAQQVLLVEDVLHGLRAAEGRRRVMRDAVAGKRGRAKRRGGDDRARTTTTEDTAMPRRG